MLNVSITGDAKLIQRLGKMPDEVRKSLTRKVTALTFKLQALVKTKLSGQVLKVRSGRLRNSIFPKITSTSTSVTGKVASAGVPYAGPNEYGASVPATVIYPRKAQALAFMMNGKMVFAKYVNHPAFKVPERSYLRSSLKDMQKEIQEGLIEAVKTPLKAKS